MLLLDALLKGEDRLTDDLQDVEGSGLDLQLSRLDAGKIQHAAHQPGKPLDLSGDDPEIMAFLILPMVPSKMPSIKPAMEVIGVFSSWETLAMNCAAWIQHAIYVRDRAMLLKDMASWPISSSLSMLIRVVKSPWPNFLAAADISRRGRTIFRVTK